LATLVVDALRARGVLATRILEPTCGSGAFIEAAAATFPAAELVGVEYQQNRYGAALEALASRRARLTVRYDNAYALDFGSLPWRSDGPLLVVGNPPWVTAAALGRGAADVLQPPRSNPKGLRGLAARTGAANFDVAEFLLLKLLRELRPQRLTLAMLVKESVARKVLTCADRLKLGIASAEIVRINARQWFGVAVDACCLIAEAAPVAGGLQLPVPIRADFGSAANASFRPPADGDISGARFLFRQGVKHDAAGVFELRARGGRWYNGYGDAIDVEAAYVYPLLKARALHYDERGEATAMIVPQQRLGAPTDVLAEAAPRLWRYLQTHAGRIAARKSSIYRNAPPFAIFGIGPYTFAPWKVAVAGFYAQPRFRVVGPVAGRPVVFGDTSYFVPFENEAGARAFAERCASPAAAALIAARVVPGKRPITKHLLDTMNWADADLG
jgi:hypothetical protein